MRVEKGVARAFAMTDEAWRRHANPWSVWTRFAAIPPLVLGVWSRAWIGWWCLVPVGLVAVWLWINPRVFAPVDEPRSWAERGIHGERLWVKEGLKDPEHRAVMRLHTAVGLIGLAMLVYGLIALSVWPAVCGPALIVLCQLWRIDRYTRLFDEHAAERDAA